MTSFTFFSPAVDHAVESVISVPSLWSVARSRPRTPNHADWMPFQPTLCKSEVPTFENLVLDYLARAAVETSLSRVDDGAAVVFIILVCTRKHDRIRSQSLQPRDSRLSGAMNSGVGECTSRVKISSRWVTRNMPKVDM